MNILPILFSIWIFAPKQGFCNEGPDQTRRLNVLNTTQYAKCLHDNETVSVEEMEMVSKMLVESCQHLGIQLIRTLSRYESKSDSKGLIFSPSSLWSTLMVTYLGSRGETEKELRKRLKLSNISKTSVAMAFNGIQMWQKLKGTTKNNVTTRTYFTDVNKIFVSDRLKINSCFRDIFPSIIEQKKFATQPETALENINEWVKNQTHSKIVDLLPAGSINVGTKVVIANAVYFKSDWAHQFDVSKTTKDKFYVSPEEVIQVDMMNIESVNLLYAISDKLHASAVELPYSNQEHSMVIVLPSAERGLDALLRDLTVPNLQELLNSMVDDDVNLIMPKFTAEQEFELAGPLFSIGYKKIFDPRFVNLSVIFAKEADRNLTSLNSVLHKSYIKVNEEGTEAAAATAIIFARSGRPLFPTQFVANRPFLYLVRETSTNMILFVGTVRRPQSD